MVWTKDKESFLLKEVAAEGVLTHKLRSKERGTLWQTIAIKMNAVGDEVTSRSVRDHYNTMSKNYRARMAREERSTGEAGSELTEEEQLLEDLIDVEDETEQMGAIEEEARKKRIENEKGQALEMRARAMERFSQTKKRIGGDHEGEEPIKKRRSSGDMLDWLKGRIECESKEKEIEQNNKREEMEMQRLQHTEMLQVLQQTQQQMSMQMKLSDQYMQQQALQQQQQQEQQQQQFNLMQQQMMAIMQQQTQLMAKIFQNKE